MGLLNTFLDRVCEQCSSLSALTLISVGSLSVIALAVVVNVLRQLLFKNPHEPPVVFHWFPFVGSTISYGIDPYVFFNNARAKVCTTRMDLVLLFPVLLVFAPNVLSQTVWRHFHLCSPRQKDDCLLGYQG